MLGYLGPQHYSPSIAHCCALSRIIHPSFPQYSPLFPIVPHSSPFFPILYIVSPLFPHSPP